VSSPTTTLLLIDGDDMDRSYYAHRLKICSPEYVVLEAKDGESALELYRSQRVDCIVTEFELSDMSLFQLLLELVPPDGPLPVAVIVLARKILPAIAELARNHGAQACLMKRFTSGDELEQFILRAIAAVGPLRKGRHFH
jgi:DNA-binding NarL/FixJ family response regulator